MQLIYPSDYFNPSKADETFEQEFTLCQTEWINLCAAVV